MQKLNRTAFTREWSSRTEIFRWRPDPLSWFTDTQRSLFNGLRISSLCFFQTPPTYLGATSKSDNYYKTLKYAPLFRWSVSGTMFLQSEMQTLNQISSCLTESFCLPTMMVLQNIVECVDQFLLSCGYFCIFFSGCFSAPEIDKGLRKAMVH